MAYEIRWSPDAKLDYFAILEYLSSRWTEKEVINFISLIAQSKSCNSFLITRCFSFHLLKNLRFTDVSL